MQKLTKEERVLRVIKREDVDYLPSQIYFADRSRYKAISEALGLDSEEDLDNYLENHFYLTLTLQDKPLLYRDVKDVINDLNKKGFAFPDWENDVVYDVWGAGIVVGIGCFFVKHAAFCLTYADDEHVVSAMLSVFLRVVPLTLTEATNDTSKS